MTRRINFQKIYSPTGPPDLKLIIYIDLPLITNPYNMNHPPTLVIAVHGIWRESVVNPTILPFDVHWVFASKIGSPNILDPKTLNSVTPMSRRAADTPTPRDMAHSIARDLGGLDHRGRCGGPTTRSKRASLFTQEQAAQYKSDGDLDMDHYTRQVDNGSYHTRSGSAGERIPTKSFEISRDEFECVDRGGRNDNRMLLYNGSTDRSTDRPTDRPIDILENWARTYEPRSITERVRLRHRDTIEITFREVIDRIHAGFPHISELVIIDLSCNSTDPNDDTPRGERAFVRTIGQMFDCVDCVV